jgi:predicted permease
LRSVTFFRRTSNGRIVLSDLRFALRQLAKSRGFAFVAIVSLALGIGANTAIFSLVNEFLLRSLPVKNPEELVLFRNIAGSTGRAMSRSQWGNGYRDPVSGLATSTSFSLLTLERFSANHPGLSDVFGFMPVSQPNLLIDGAPEISASAQLVSGGYHAGLGVSSVIGRTLTVEDDRAGAPPVAVISERYWQNRFDGETAVLGKTIRFNKISFTIVGVTARGFNGTGQAGESADVSVPLAHYAKVLTNNPADLAQPWYWWIRIMGRVAPGHTVAQARASLEPIFQQAALEGWEAGRSMDQTPQDTPATPSLAADSGAQGENDLRRQYRRSLRILMGLVSLVLLAACANVANLLLARGAARRREIAVRLALGASRTRIVRQLLAESLVLALLGAALGTLLAWWSRGLLLALQPFGNANVVLSLPIDGRVLGFAIAVAVATAVLFGLAPALRATQLDLSAEFQGGTRTLGGGGRSRLARTLMVVQIALSLVLLVSTALFMRTLSNLNTVDAGFNRRALALFRIDLSSAGYARGQVTAAQMRVLERLELIPGVQEATFSSTPLLNLGRWSSPVRIPGSTPPSGGTTNVNLNAVAPNFFVALKMPLLFGRAFTERDDVAAPRVAIVNRTFAKKIFGDESPLGRRFTVTAGEFEIVGVCGDAKYANLREAVPPTVYIPALQHRDGNAHFAVRVAGDPSAIFPSLRAAVREIDPTLPVLNLRTQDEQLERNHAQERLFARLSGFFGALALVLACVGLYGLMSYQVLRRTGEIGLRMALGALPAHVLRMMLKESLALVCLGVILGLSGAWFGSRLVAGLLFGMSATDPSTYALVALQLVAVTLFAALVPARRAARIEPLAALRAE